MTTKAERWAVVGGGMLGMTLAHRLRQQGSAVTLYEAASTLGGLAGAWQLGDVTWDRHYHVTLLSDTALRALLAELDLERELQWVQTRTGFYVDDRLLSMSSTIDFLRFPVLGLIDKFRLGATIWYASKIRDWQRLEQIPVADWLRRWSGARTTDKIWLPLLRSKLGENYKQASAAFIWAIIARMYAARRTGLKKEMFGYVRGGYARILGSFAENLERIHVDLRVGERVSRVEKRSDSIAIESASGTIEHYDRVALTLPCPVISAICPDLSEAEHQRLNGITYQGIVCASLLLKKPLANYYVTNITDDWVPFTAVIEMTALVDPKEFGGRSLVYLPRYAAQDDPIFTVSDDDLRARFLAALERMYPGFHPDDVLSLQISRVRHVLAVSTLNYSHQVPSRETSLPGVYIVNSAQILNGTLNVNETIKIAEEAAAHFAQLTAATPVVSVGVA